ncbi:MAG TPA: glycosyltransferase family A protein [Candidatus Binatia bacterium]|jgi:glycosyltransferase involved in cell wall biosynthesis|nr:glycosyltransferase family A protein [Candidatus Binatia bacterium]
MNLPSLSVVLPNYNHGRYLPTALRSILGQTAAPLEIIVIDDASTDNSLEILSGYEREHSNLKVYRNEKNQGVVFGLNRGLALARGEYVTFPGADDEVVAGLFEKSLALLARYPQAGLCCTVAEWRETFSGLTWHMAAGMAAEPSYLSPDDLVRLGKNEKLCIITSSCLFKTEPLRSMGGFPPELRWHADWFACYVTGFRHGVCFVPEVLSLANLLPRSFYQSGHKTGEHRQVILKLLERLNTEAFADVVPRLRDSGALSLFAMPVLRLVAGRPEFRHFLNPTLVRRTLRRSTELQAKRFFPAWLARWCLNRFYRLPGQRA